MHGPNLPLTLSHRTQLPRCTQLHARTCTALLAWWCLSIIADGTVRMSARAPHPSDVWWLTRKAHRAQQSHCLTLAPCIYTRFLPYRIPCCRLLAASLARKETTCYSPTNHDAAAPCFTTNRKARDKRHAPWGSRKRAGTTCKTHTGRVGSICSNASTRDTTIYIYKQWLTDNLSLDKRR